MEQLRSWRLYDNELDTGTYIEYIDLLVQFIDTKSRENLDRDREREKQGGNIESYSN